MQEMIVINCITILATANPYCGLISLGHFPGTGPCRKWPCNTLCILSYICTAIQQITDLQYNN